MSEWLIVPSDRLAELDAINAAHEGQRCTALQTTTGVWVTGSDKLEDSYWADWHEFLDSLSEFVGMPEFPQSEAQE